MFFESYNNHVFDLTVDGILAYLFEGREWHSERFVSRPCVQALFEAYRRPDVPAECDPLTRARQADPLWRIAGLELWLRERKRGLDSPSPCHPFLETAHGHPSEHPASSPG